jgi:ATP-dependent RNA helicase DOB1
MSSLKRKSTDDTPPEPQPPHKQHQRVNDSPLSANGEEPVACLHDVSYPEGYVPPPPSSPASAWASAPAREFPFTLDPFQSESINCLENGESVMVFISSYTHTYIHTYIHILPLSTNNHGGEEKGKAE